MPSKPAERGRRALNLDVAELTYIDLTENNVYYAANHNQGVEHIPGITKIALSEVEQVVGELDVRSAKTRTLFTLTLKSKSTYAGNLKHAGAPCYFSRRAHD